MRRSVVAGLVVGLVMAASMPLAAQQDEVASQRLEIPEAGMAIDFPADWSIDVEMLEREDWGLSERFEDAAPLVFWSVLYASLSGWPWCDVSWYPEHPMSLAEHATEYELLMTPTSSEVERPIEVTPVTLPAAEAYRFVIYNEASDDYTTTYLLESDAAHYFLQCVDSERAADDWLVLAESIELLGTEPAIVP